MGDTQSSQSTPEQEEADPAPEKPWDPDDIRFSSDEGDTTIPRFVPQPPEPEPPPQSAQSSQYNRPGRSHRKSTSTDGSDDQRSSSAADVASSARDLAASMFEKKAQSATVNESSDSQKTAKQKVRKNKFELQPSDIEFPQLDQTQQEDNTIQQREEADADEVDPMNIVNASGTKRLQVRLKPSKARYACPEAEKYHCDKTFASEKLAQRHIQTHLGPLNLECPVCLKVLSRIDKLNAHKKSHSRKELEDAVARQAAQQDEQKEENETTVDAGDVNGLGATRAEPEVEPTPDVEDPSISTPKASVHALVAQSSDAIMTGDVDQSSADTSATSASVFDESADKDIIEETPRPKSRLKRKRDGATLSQAVVPSDVPSKRRRRHSLSPPTSIASLEDQDNQVEQQGGISENAVPFKILPKSRNTGKIGNLDNFAKAWTPGSQLYHPIHNPRSPRVGPGHRVQMVVPQTARAGPSTSSAVKLRNTRLNETTNDDDDQQSILPEKSIYTSPKGKRKAEAGVTYSSPPPPISDDEVPEEVEPAGMATSVARRTSSAGKPRKRSKNTQNEKSVARLEDSDSGLSSRDAADAEKPFVCQECQRKFFTKDGLRKHKQRPNVHAKLHECDDCTNKFMTVEDLKNHQKTTGHGDGTGYAGRKGAFSAGEVRKLRRWRQNFCQDNDINIPTFNQMMTDSCRRTKGFQWPYRFISKGDFLQEYYDLLPDRNRRSMHRYRERAFQNVPENQEWTQEDDEELEQLVREIGQKWVEIGQRMTRTQDSVSQRWRFKLQYKGRAHQGEWLKSEEEKLRLAVAEVKRASGLPTDPHADVRIPWDTVSKKLKEKRTAQQCSNKWRQMTQKRSGNKFFKISDTDSKPGTPFSSTTPSRMSQRLSGQTPSKSSTKKFISEELVQESDDNDTHRDKQAEEGAESSDTDSTDSDQSDNGHLQAGSPTKFTPFKTPTTTRKAPSSKTPQDSHSLSQAFAQTQANTSALRAPSTSHKQHTQTEMPTPGLPIQHKPVTSSWRAIDREDLSANDVDDGLVEIDSPKTDSVNEDAIMAEPESSDAESRSTQDTSDSLADAEASKVSEPEDPISANEDQTETESTASESGSTSSSESDHSIESDAEVSESDSATGSTQKEAFVQSLQSSQILDKRPQSKTNWGSVIHGRRDSVQQETESESEDEGDIAHH